MAPCYSYVSVVNVTRPEAGSKGFGERCEGKPSRRAGTGWNYVCRALHPHEKRRPVTASVLYPTSGARPPVVLAL
eukprot:6053876-Pyramimonas_sp.AAC.1